ncbi:class I SAM-dependent methyltransferase [Fusibacter sp. 3D3]|uniref:class I SAM-dependent methyltransferase n=1 Tax=Fusibacter sp. 3D3 TaxID=1048380 RepID=UPI0008530E0D|nr:class I SAM-dependent methyltransferase [Fusibacter sp. 3D3]GAU78897.1 SAM-dependent methyltransferases [Fusibacter sp. 3D3]
MLNKLTFYLKLGQKWIQKEVVDATDYKAAYDEVSKTYSLWLEKMGQYTDQLISSETIPLKESLKVLDFACGTGYITKKLLESSSNYVITAVDQSSEMLKTLVELDHERIHTICSDGLSFLKHTTETYDIIFFGWALSYFDHHEVFKLFNKVLKPNGTLAIITNVNGTLDKIEDIFLKTMAENPTEVIKPMSIKQNLPNGRKGLSKWCHQSGFETIETHEKEAVYQFDTPEKLLEWLNLTGAAAGTQMIFKNYERVKPALIKAIQKEKYHNGTYSINHKFVYGVFRKVARPK